MEQNKYLELHELVPSQVYKFEKDIPIEDKKNSNKRKFRRCSKVFMVLDNNKYHEYLGYNKFSKEEYKLPLDDWLTSDDLILRDYGYEKENDENICDFDEFKINYLEDWNKQVIKNICNPENNNIFSQSDILNFDDLYNDKEWYKYNTLDNYHIGYIVFVSKTNNKIIVYANTNKIITRDTNIINRENLFTIKILDMDYIEIFIGESKYNMMTSRSGSYGNKLKGNSILILVKEKENEYTYIYIGTKIYQFITQEKILKYISSVGNNCIPYPYAESANWCYDMSEPCKTKKEYNQKRKIKGYLENVWDNDEEYTKTKNYENLEGIYLDKKKLIYEYTN